MNAVYYIEVNMICIISLVLLLPGAFKIKGDRRMDLYRGLMIATIVLCFSDMIGGALRGMVFPGARIILWGINMLYYEATFVMGVMWVLYVMYVLYGRIYKRIAVAAIAVSAAAAILILTAPLNGYMFTIKPDNYYQRGPLLFIHWVVLFAFMVLPSLIAPFTHADKKARKAISMFAIMPSCTMAIQVLVYGITVSQVGITGSIIMVYVMLQSQKVNEAVTRAELLDEISNTDVLSRLHNRRAYEMRINELNGSEWVGALFADLNGLKKENDTKGHSAGDLLICRFADSLRTVFPEEDIFRISGDEFVVLSTDREGFKEACGRMIVKAGDVASAGMSEGTGEEVLDVIRRAEKEMYRKKYEYYRDSHEDRRLR